MLVHRRNFLRLSAGAGLALAAAQSGLTAAKTGRPIIDVHMHSYPADGEMPNPLVNPISGKKLGEILATLIFSAPAASVSVTETGSRTAMSAKLLL